MELELDELRRELWTAVRNQWPAWYALGPWPINEAARLEDLGWRLFSSPPEGLLLEQLVQDSPGIYRATASRERGVYSCTSPDPAVAAIVAALLAAAYPEALRFRDEAAALTQFVLC